MFVPRNVEWSFYRPPTLGAGGAFIFHTALTAPGNPRDPHSFLGLGDLGRLRDVRCKYTRAYPFELAGNLMREFDLASQIF